MQHYYFHVSDSVTGRDDIGLDLSSPSEALRHAVQYAGDCLRLDQHIDVLGAGFGVEVTDAHDVTIYRVNVSAFATSAVRDLEV